MTAATWYPFPGRPGYEISSVGGLRTTDGELVPLECLENSDVRFYRLQSTTGDYSLKYTPDNLIDRYLPAAKNLVSTD